MRAITLANTLAAAVAAAVLVAAASSSPPSGPAPRSPTPASIAAPVRPVTFAEGLDHPWGLAFLPDGRALVTERPGRLRLVDRSGAVSPPIEGVPAVVAKGQGGLLDVALDPQFAENHLIYLSYAEAGEGGAGTAVARAR